MHHLAAQRDNRLTQDISNLTTDIALQTQRDGASMSTLAFVTAVFLPGTFVCSVLSTVFFSYDGISFAVSTWWWLLPVAVVPLTAAVLYLWFFVYRARVRRDKTLLQTQRAASSS
ncbi:hypothetical protein VTL71DRAFT_5434 [Oculimacula yallundae]|uniref:Uncharacterized protein n=1 Tax=Oculimacula yallundae TaxID=86028 RepID=A0ABR4C179_9HELO